MGEQVGVGPGVEEHLAVGLAWGPALAKVVELVEVEPGGQGHQPAED